MHNKKKAVFGGIGLAGLLLLSTLLGACGDNAAARDAFPTPVTNPAASQIVAPASPGPIADGKVNFPLDEAPHNDITEWWYYTGHLTTTDGSLYGFEYVIFQGVRSGYPVGYASHFAITDLNKQNFKFDQKISFSPKAVQFGGTTGFDLALDTWTMQGLNGTDHLKAATTDKSYAIDLTATDLKGPVLHGSGLFSYGAAGSSYYYSRPQMSVSGTLMVDGQAKTIKDGITWFDHQWGNFIPLAGGWDWFSLQLQDNSQVMVYYLRDADNKLVDLFGTYVPPCATTCQPANDQVAKSVDLQRSDFVIQPAGQWTSPTNGGVYPSGWDIQIKSANVPALSLKISPLLANQELTTTASTGVIYWEGACQVSGTKDGQPLNGQAYVELTGYAKSSKS